MTRFFDKNNQPKNHPTKASPSYLALLGLCSSLLLAGCMTSATPQYVIDSDSYQSQGKSERIKYIILHYTAENETRSLEILTKGNVSAHYLIPEADNNIIYNLVPDSERAWHAGAGGFAGREILNDTSIGIEIVNLGIAPEYRGHKAQTALDANNGYHPYTHYVDFTDVQIKKVAQLVQNLVRRYDIQPTDIIGHSDMAPSRKIDPGAKFPWERLYKDYGIGAWYDDVDKNYFMNSADYETATIADIKQQFRDYGYQINDTNEWDRASRNVIYAFQLHFRPHRANGIMDVETYAILRALNRKYIGNRSLE